MQRWHFCAFWRVLLLPPLLGPRSGCTQREAMINGGNHAYGARIFQIYMVWGVFWSSSLSNLHAKLFLCSVDAEPVVPPRGDMCPLDNT